MIKREEISDPNSCLNRAAEDEIIFTLRAHDIAFPYTVRKWAGERIRLGKNGAHDDQILYALRDAEKVEQQQLEEAADAIYDVFRKVPAICQADGRDKAVQPEQREELLAILKKVELSRRNEVPAYL